MKKLIAAAASLAVGLTGFASAAEVTYRMSDTLFKGDTKHGLWLSNFFNGGTGISKGSQYWNLDSTTSFLVIDDVAKTATIEAYVTNDTVSEMGFRIDMAFTLLEGAARPDDAFCQTISDADCLTIFPGLDFYEMGDASLTGTGELGGITATLTDRGTDPRHPFQFGFGGDAFNADAFGGSTWMNVNFTPNTDTVKMVNGKTYDLNLSQTNMHGDLNFAATVEPDTGEIPVPGAVILFGTVAAAFGARRKLAA